MVSDRLPGAANAGQEQVTDADADDDVLETAEPPGATDDDTPRERTAVRERRLPSSIGLSVLLPGQARRLGVRVTWGDYRLEGIEAPDSTPVTSREIWKRTARNENVDLNVSLAVDQPVETEVPGSEGLFVALLVRPLGAAFSEAALPAGAKTISVFLVNKRRPEQNDRVKDRAFAFQVRLELHAEVPFLARPDIRGLFTNDWDDEVADLQYRDCGEYTLVTTWRHSHSSMAKRISMAACAKWRAPAGFRGRKWSGSIRRRRFRMSNSG